MLRDLADALREFIHLSQRRQIAVIVILVLSYSTLWYLNFYTRRSSVQHAIRFDYSKKLERAAQCRHDHAIESAFHSECFDAYNMTQFTLYETANNIAWQNSYFCGGQSCFELVFGNDVSSLGVVIRFIFVAMIASMGVVLVNWFGQFLRSIDQFAKNTSRARYDRDDYVAITSSSPKVVDLSPRIQSRYKA